MNPLPRLASARESDVTVALLRRLADVLGIPLAGLQALDPRITPGVQEWMEEQPRVGALLRRLSERPDRDAVLAELEAFEENL
jgi:hypothetical protein